MSASIGIDLGTTNSCVATVEGGRAQVITSAEGERTTPSVVAFTKDGERLVGSVAQRQAALNADRTISSIKREMGTNYSIDIDGKRFNAQEISAMILRKLKGDAEKYLGQEVTDAVITVPAYFDDVQRQATKDAGRIAGLNVMRIINEPTSAALAYGLDNGRSQKVMVYDLGGGTFDVSIISIEDDVIEVLATAGDNHLGGDDFDDCIVEYLLGKLKEQVGSGFKADAMVLQRLREAAVTAKKELSSAVSSTVNLPFLTQTSSGPVHFECMVTRAVFDQMTEGLIARTTGPVKQALSDAGLTASQLDQVLLVGGSTRIPAVQKHVKQLTGKEPSNSVNPDECVAQGAAIQAATLSSARSGGAGLSTDAPGAGLLLLDVTPLTLSIETQGNVATPLIDRNTTLPAHYSQIFTTASPFQTQVEIKVLQGERPRASDNKCIGKFRLKGIKMRDLQPQIEVTFDIDANGILRVSAQDLNTGQQQSITIDDNERMSDAEIEEAIREAQQYSSEDGLRREIAEVKREANQLINEANTALNKHGKDIDRDAKRQIRADLASLQKLANRKPRKGETEDPQAIRDAIQQLRLSSSEIRAMPD